MTRKNYPSFKFIRNFFDEGEFTIRGIRRLFEDEEFYIRSDDEVLDVWVDPDFTELDKKHTRFPEFLEKHLKDNVTNFVESIEIKPENLKLETPEDILNEYFFTIDSYLSDLTDQSENTLYKKEIRLVIKYTKLLREKIIAKFPALSAKIGMKVNNKQFYIRWESNKVKEFDEFYKLANNELFIIEKKELKDLLLNENSDPSIKIVWILKALKNKNKYDKSAIFTLLTRLQHSKIIYSNFVFGINNVKSITNSMYCFVKTHFKLENATQFTHQSLKSANFESKKKTDKNPKLEMILKKIAEEIKK